MPGPIPVKELSRYICNSVHTSTFEDHLCDKLLHLAKSSGSSLDKVYI